MTEWLPPGEIPDHACEAWFWSSTEHFDDYETLEGPYAQGKVMRVELFYVMRSLTAETPDLMVFDRSMGGFEHLQLETLQQYAARFRIMPIPEPVRPDPPSDTQAVAEFVECESCRRKVGHPLLCSSCIERRAQHEKANR